MSAQSIKQAVGREKERREDKNLQQFRVLLKYITFRYMSYFGVNDVERVHVMYKSALSIKMSSVVQIMILILYATCKTTRLPGDEH